MSVVPIVSGVGGSKVDNALQAIEVALQELVSCNATQALITARWAKHSNDAALGVAIVAAASNRGLS